jgi:hypothetical protein
MSMDDFREAGTFLEDDDQPASTTTYTPQSRGGSGSSSGGGVLGITPFQRFILSLLLLMMACLLGAFFLIATGRVIPPGLY